MLGEHPTFDDGDTTTRTDDNAGNVSIDQFQPDIFNVIRNEKAKRSTRRGGALLFLF